MDEKMTLIDSIEVSTEPPSQIITDDDWDPDYSENTVAPTDMPSAIITDDDWDPTFNVGELLMDEMRMLQLIQGNNTSTQTIDINYEMCVRGCNEMASDAQSAANLNYAYFFTIQEVTTTSLRSVDFEQGPCTPCAADVDPPGRLLQEFEFGSATLTVTITFNDEISTEGLVDDILESPSFAAATITLEDVTDGTATDTQIEPTLISQAPTPVPTSVPTEPRTSEPTPARPITKKPTKSPKRTKKPKKARKTPAPTNKPTKQPKKSSKKTSKKTSKR